MRTASYSNDPREYAEREAGAAAVNDFRDRYARVCGLDSRPAAEGCGLSDAEVAEARAAMRRVYAGAYGNTHTKGDDHASGTC